MVPTEMCITEVGAMGVFSDMISGGFIVRATDQPIPTDQFLPNTGTEQQKQWDTWTDWIQLARGLQ